MTDYHAFACIYYITYIHMYDCTYVVQTCIRNCMDPTHPPPPWPQHLASCSSFTRVRHRAKVQHGPESRLFVIDGAKTRFNHESIVSPVSKPNQFQSGRKFWDTSRQTIATMLTNCFRCCTAGDAWWEHQNRHFLFRHGKSNTPPPSPWSCWWLLWVKWNDLNSNFFATIFSWK